MDTDFEEECKDIVKRRKEAEAKLKKIDKELAKVVPPSPGKMQDMLAIVSTACQVCNSKDDDDAMLLCDGCDNGYHTYCTVPPIEVVPEGDWFCKDCEKELSTGAEGGNITASAESKKGSAKSRRRKSRWSSGVLTKKKSVKKKLLESDAEDKEGDDAEEKDGDGNEDGEKEKSKDDGKQAEKDASEEPSAGPSHIPDLTPSSPRPVREATMPMTNNPQEDLVAPSVPTGVRIDSNKVMQWMNDLVRFTEGFTVEKLERIYTAMAKVIRRYRTLTDRTDLPTDLQAELEVVKSQERDFGQRQRDAEFARNRR